MRLVSLNFCLWWLVGAFSWTFFSSLKSHCTVNLSSYSWSSQTSSPPPHTLNTIIIYLKPCKIISINGRSHYNTAIFWILSFFTSGTAQNTNLAMAVENYSFNGFSWNLKLKLITPLQFFKCKKNSKKFKPIFFWKMCLLHWKSWV